MKNSDNVFIYKHKKLLIATTVIVFVLVVSVSAFFIIWNSLHSAVVSVTVAPSIAKVFIGDTTYDSVGTYKVIPGEYDVLVEADGFLPKTGKLVAVANETVNILLYLEPTEDNNSWYSEHPVDALIVGEAKNNQLNENLEQLMEDAPILRQLPINIDYFTKNYAKRIKYTISYVLVDSISGFKITITDETGGNYEDALEKLRARGVNPEEYEIEYNDVSVDYKWGYAGN